MEVKLPAFLVSLPRSSSRREHLEPQLRKYAANITWVVAYDGWRQIPLGQVDEILHGSAKPIHVCVSCDTVWLSFLLFDLCKLIKNANALV
jgi:hypothetical protein